MRGKITSVLSLFFMAGLFHAVLVAPSYGAEVVMDEYSFSPKTVEVKVGETVTWINKGDLYHSAERLAERGEECESAGDETFSSYALWPENKKAGDRFKRVFDKPGIYPYYCRKHCEEEKMMGVVIVK